MVSLAGLVLFELPDEVIQAGEAQEAMVVAPFTICLW
jgi:hypothetical protein